MNGLPNAEDLEGVLRGLKDFQRDTVDYVFDRLYGEGATGRFLVADEVGLGKTLVARGVIARAIAHLASTVDRIDVIYVCSNADIARQNINRLKIERGQHTTIASRLTMLPVELKRLKESRLNFVSFTPDTSFDVRRGLGRSEERVLLYTMLQAVWSLGTAKAPMNVLQGHADADTFRERVRDFDVDSLDTQAVGDFHRALNHNAEAARAAGQPDLQTRFDALCEAYSSSNRSVPAETIRERTHVVGELRAVLAASCVNALEPDLVILDEFQRFTHLLDGGDDASRLARELFSFPNVRVLMLSATPYKMYTLHEDAQGEDHYRDFLRTVRFLENGPGPEPIESVVREYQAALHERVEGTERGRLHVAKRGLEDRLRRVMVRTERLASTPDRNGMLRDIPANPPPIRATDLTDYVALQNVARTLKQEDDTLEYWKSAPFLLNFMDDGYKLRRELDKAVEAIESRGALARALAPSHAAVLPWTAIERYQAIDPGNARLRALVRDVVDAGAWRLLWVPPALPYYRLRGPFAEASGFTKRLVFSTWRVVPRAIAGMMSYEVERRMFEGDRRAENTPEARKKRKPLLRFTRDTGGRLGGMPVLALLYPSAYLAKACDPARLAAERGAESTSTPNAVTSLDAVDLDALLAIARERIEVALRRIDSSSNGDGPPDERWYWAAPLLLDRHLMPGATRAWFAQKNLAAEWSGDAEELDSEEEAETDHWAAHVEVARGLALAETTAAAALEEPLGRMPDDLVEVMARLAVAGPAVTMFRALDRVVGGESTLNESERTAIRNAAGRTAWAFRSLFNQPEVMSMLREGHRGATAVPYWKRVLDYCVDGCLQSVLDEYAHVLRDHVGAISGSVRERVGEIADWAIEALRLRTSRIGIHDVAVSESGRTVRIEARRLRTHFALRFGDEKSEDGKVVTRADQVRKAFNSPFWPFVVATTSVGQEGLDFHTYCHAVVHWNLPSNPVDLEQREGRVHRYKGHAVRKNVAQAHGWTALEAEKHDPWEEMFELAKAARVDGSSDIVPYWVYATEGGARIERHVLSLPLSREREQIRWLTKSLALYRMVFGQPRQEDLLQHLVARVGSEDLAGLSEDLRIDLGPR